MKLRNQSSIPLTTDEMDDNLLELSQRMTLQDNQTLQGIKSFDNIFIPTTPKLSNNIIANLEYLRKNPVKNNTKISESLPLSYDKDGYTTWLHKDIKFTERYTWDDITGWFETNKLKKIYSNTNYGSYYFILNNGDLYYSHYYLNSSNYSMHKLIGFENPKTLAFDTDNVIIVKQDNSVWVKGMNQGNKLYSQISGEITEFTERTSNITGNIIKIVMTYQKILILTDLGEVWINGVRVGFLGGNIDYKLDITNAIDIESSDQNEFILCNNNKIYYRGGESSYIEVNSSATFLNQNIVKLSFYSDILYMFNTYNDLLSYKYNNAEYYSKTPFAYGAVKTYINEGSTFLVLTTSGEIYWKGTDSYGFYDSSYYVANAFELLNTINNVKEIHLLDSMLMVELNTGELYAKGAYVSDNWKQITGVNTLNEYNYNYTIG
jgi:hypothetical protein